MGGYRIIGFYTDDQKRVRPITERIGRRRGVARSYGLTLRRIRQIHEARSERAKAIDESLEAQLAASYSDWVKYPNRYDILGVDFFPIPTVPGNPKLNVILVRDRIPEYFDLPKDTLKSLDFEFITSPKEWEKLKRIYRFSDECAAFYNPKTDKIVFSPRASKLISKGKIENFNDMRFFKVIAHELMHKTFRDLFKRYDPRGKDYREHYLSLQINEALAEIHAHRFVLNNIQMPRRLRNTVRNLKIGGKYNLDYFISYEPFVRTLSFYALVVNDFDEKKAVKWLEEIAFNPRKSRKMIDASYKKIERLAEKASKKCGYLIIDGKKVGYLIPHETTDIRRFLHEDHIDFDYAKKITIGAFQELVSIVYDLYEKSIYRSYDLYYWLRY